MTGTSEHPPQVTAAANHREPPERLGPPSAPASKPVPLLRLLVAIVASLLVAAVVYGVSRTLPKTYQASGTFRVTVPNQQGINDTVVTAANDLATQYVQLATAAPVLDATAQALRVPSSTLSGHILASTVSAQNLVQVTASASSPSVATARAGAAVTALAAYVQRINLNQIDGYAHNIATSLAPINRSIARLTTVMNNATVTAQRQGDSAVLSALLTQRTQALQSLTTNAAAGQPAIQIISSAGGASVSYPKPSLYALIALVVALLIAVRLAFLSGSRPRTASAPDR